MRVPLAYGILGLLTIAVGCAGPSTRADPAMPDGSVGDGPGHTPGTPGLGAHTLKFQAYHEPDHPVTVLSTSPMSTQTSGSTIIVGIGRGDNTKFVLPTDNKGNSPYRQVDVMHAYAPNFTESGTALYAFPSAHGGPGHTIAATTPADDEITLAAVEVVDGTHVQDYKWNQGDADPLTSLEVTTTGPATLIAFWWGGGFPDTEPQTAIPDNGFQVIDKNVETLGGFVQCAVAVKNVTNAGPYSVTWTSTPNQSAQLWLIAVQ